MCTDDTVIHSLNIWNHTIRSWFEGCYLATWPVRSPFQSFLYPNLYRNYIYPKFVYSMSWRERDSTWTNERIIYKGPLPVLSTPMGAPLTEPHKNLDSKETVRLWRSPFWDTGQGEQSPRRANVQHRGQLYSRDCLDMISKIWMFTSFSACFLSGSHLFQKRWTGT